MSNRDYKAEAAKAVAAANIHESYGRENMARLCRIAAAVYEERAQWLSADDPRAPTSDQMLLLDRIIAAGEDAACGEEQHGESTSAKGEPAMASRTEPARVAAPDVTASPAPSPTKRPQDYRKGDTLPKELRGADCGFPSTDWWACCRKGGHELPHIATAGHQLICDPYGDDGKPWVEPSHATADPMYVPGKRLERRVTDLLNAATDPAPDAEALRLAEWCAASAEKARRFALGFTNRTREAFEADAATFDAIASRLRGEKGAGT